MQWQWSHNIEFYKKQQQISHRNMAKLDIEEKFKKDISKEVANLKEFLISQGKEIVKLKQENKVGNIPYLRERSN